MSKEERLIWNRVRADLALTGEVRIETLGIDAGVGILRLYRVIYITDCYDGDV
jgi:hypothetical protein